jgi:hypothetical protein
MQPKLALYLVLIVLDVAQPIVDLTYCVGEFVALLSVPAK